MEDMHININSVSQHNYILDMTLIKLFFKTVKSGNLEEIKKEVCKLNTDINLIVDQNNQNVLTYAALISDDTTSFKALKYFIEELHVDPNWEDKYKQTPLFYTARNGLLLSTSYLIENGCDVNGPDKHNQTPIFYAARDGRKEVVHLLISKGADLIHKDSTNQTCINFAISNNRFDVVEYILNILTSTDGLDMMNMEEGDDWLNELYNYAFSRGRVNIADLIAKKGRLRIGSIANKNSNKNKLINDNSSLKKFVLVKIVDGKKIILSPQEVDSLLKQNNFLNDIINNP